MPTAKRIMMKSLYLLQFASFIFILVNAAFLGLGSLHARWKSRRYECSRWMIFFSFIVLACHYLLQMVCGFRASGDDKGAVINMLVYTPCFMLIAKGVYNVETTRKSNRNMNVACAVQYAVILATFVAGYWQTGSFRIGHWLYLMLFFYSVSMVYCVAMVIREMVKRRRILETMTATDMLPYVRYSGVSLLLLCSSALLMPALIMSTRLLIVIAPIVMLFVLFFTLTFITLGNNYIPTDELLDRMDDEATNSQNDGVGENTYTETAASRVAATCADGNATSVRPVLTDSRQQEIRQKLDRWCQEGGYKDSTVNMLTLSRNINVNRGDLTLYFDQCLGCTFRIWLSDIRFNVAKAMMTEFPEYSNDVISAECGFSARSQLYRIFKAKEGCTPSAWRSSLE